MCPLCTFTVNRGAQRTIGLETVMVFRDGQDWFCTAVTGSVAVFI
ncbi:MAG: hypothetical protein U5K38_09420 [Woeseiaceae bacterium]|nr:hypothetical protein [Woeseiaceae bacterium]